jgi:hypothetical protein
MFRRLGLAPAACLGVGVPRALAAFPSPMAQQGQALAGKDHTVSFIARGVGGETVVTAERANGSVLRSQRIDGQFGIPMVTPNGLTGGLFRDGRAFVLQSMGYNARTHFKVVRTKDLRVRQSISLKGTFAYDALSPSGSRLYLIQHTSSRDLEHYVVRAYDLRTKRLLPGKIADKTQEGWVMQGFPVTRSAAAAASGVYTLYMNPGGYPFVHALDTVRGVAHCIGVAWQGTDQGPLMQFRLGINGRRLVVRNETGGPYRIIDRRTYRVMTP